MHACSVIMYIPNDNLFFYNYCILIFVLYPQKGRSDCAPCKYFLLGTKGNLNQLKCVLSF